MIEISVKDYSSFALSWNSKEAESFIWDHDNIEFYNLLKSELDQIFDQLNSRKFLDLIQLKQNPFKIISKLLQQLEAPKQLISKCLKEINDWDKKEAELREEIGHLSEKLKRFENELKFLKEEAARDGIIK